MHVRDLAMGTDASRYQVHVAMPEDGGHVAASDLVRAGVAVHAVPMAAGLSLSALAQIRTLVAGAALVHVHGARAALYGRLAALSLGRSRPRLVYTIHGFAAPHYRWPKRSVLVALERALSGVTDTYVAVCRAERESFLGADIRVSARMCVVLNGIDVGRVAEEAQHHEAVRASLGLSSADRILITVCRLYKPRDFRTLLSALRRVVDTCPRAHLLIVGDGPYRSDIGTLLSALGLTDHVHLLGLRRDVPALLGAAQAFVLSTAQWEGLPLTVLEAMAAGLPVVASDVGGVCEAIDDGQTGYVVPPPSPEALAERLVGLLGDEPRAKEMGQRGQARACAHFTVKRMVAETMDVYERTLARRLAASQAATHTPGEA